MRGFDRVVVEPSGIFDVDEFFDILHQHGVHIYCAKVVFQNAHLMPLLYQIPHIAAQKGGLACAQKAGDEIHLNHIFLPPLQKPSQRRSAREGLYS